MRWPLLPLLLALAPPALTAPPAAPVVTLRQGTYTGLALPTFTQTAFLGIPYAPKPSRFTPSVPLHPRTPSSAHYNATTYGTSCPAYGTDTLALVAAGTITLGEDCLSLNIIRPSTPAPTAPLPVLVWLYGGGWQQGASADPRYNLSYLVAQSSLATPVIGVSINYRTGAFGFATSDALLSAGATNLGLRDQRSALQWIQANIAAFGGDPARVTIWGESAGAYSVGAHLLAYGGRDDGLFAGAILESGGAVGPPWNGTDWYQPLWETVAARVGCDAADLSCFRAVEYEKLYPAADVGVEWFATRDALMPDYPSRLVKARRMVRVPLLVGTNTDEGTSFGAAGVETDDDAVRALTSSKRWNLDRAQAEGIWKLYSRDPGEGSPYGTGNRTWPALGRWWKRYSSVAGDLTMEAPRRQLAQAAVAGGTARGGEKGAKARVYSYRFDAPLVNATSRVGVGHFQDIPFVFSNPEKTLTPLGDDPGDLELGHLMARMWTSFAATGDPNAHGLAGVGRWPRYGEGGARNFVFRRGGESYVESDDYRVAEMAAIGEVVR
ncbi:carotenoid ester lipase-like protein precursor [Geopyxis carbonaria]|nr:carotenoid ester lipase-like protein precursor [Geopyxis carbonaria]